MNIFDIKYMLQCYLSNSSLSNLDWENNDCDDKKKNREDIQHCSFEKKNNQERS